MFIKTRKKSLNYAQQLDCTKPAPYKKNKRLI